MNNKEKIVEFVLIGVVVYLIFFLRIDSFPIRPWDESVYAVNAYEMIKNGNYVVPYFDGKPDLMHAKPPLTTWIQILFIKFLGFNEIAVRLPSAICGALACIFLFFFLKKNFGKGWAWNSFLILVTSSGFVHFHTSRTGDTDALLTLFLFLNNLFFLNFLTEENNKNKNIFLYFIFLALAFLTKSFAALLFLPAHFILLIMFKKTKYLLSSSAFYIGLLIAGIFCVGFLLLREHYQPGYISFVFQKDILKLSEEIEGHKQPFDFYFNNFFYQRYSIWIGLFIIGVLFLFLNEKDKKIKTICISSLISIAGYLLIISFSVTKLEWYDMPLYPLLAIVAGYACVKILDIVQINSFSQIKQTGIILIVFSIPLYYAIKSSHDNVISPGEKKLERLSEYIYKKEKTGFNFDGWLVINKWFNGPLLFYKYKLAEKNQIINLTDESNVKSGDKVLLMDEEAKKTIESKFEFKIIDTFNEVVIYEIIHKKEN